MCVGRFLTVRDVCEPKPTIASRNSRLSSVECYNALLGHFLVLVWQQTRKLNSYFITDDVRQIVDSNREIMGRCWLGTRVWEFADAIQDCGRVRSR